MLGLLAQLVQSAALTGQRSLVRAQYNPHQSETLRRMAQGFAVQAGVLNLFKAIRRNSKTLRFAKANRGFYLQEGV